MHRIPADGNRTMKNQKSSGALLRNEARTLIRSAGKPFYIYLLSRPTGEPFYVGKGQDERLFDHERDAINTPVRTHKLNVIRALHKAGHSVHYQLDGFFSVEADALERERELIQFHGRYDLGTGSLTNQTDGGEGPANFSEETRQRHRDTLAGVLDDGSERSAVNSFYLKIGIPVRSVPIKPLQEHRPEPLTPHPQPRKPSLRQAAALAAAAIGNGTVLEPGTRLNRRFNLDGYNMVIETGVGRDLLKSGMALVESAKPMHEIIEVTPFGYEAAVRLLGKDRLIGLGALMPNE
jgi:hypothetical protein